MLKNDILKKHTGRDLIAEEKAIRNKLDEKPDDIKERKKLIKILLWKRDLDEAIEISKKVLRYKPNDRETLGIIGYIYYEKDDMIKALEYFNKSLDIEPHDAFVMFLAGNAYSRIGKIKEAILNYDLAICLDLDIYNAHLGFAKNYDEIGEKSKALNEYIIAYEIDPRDKKVKEKIKALQAELKRA